ncbi:RimK family protein [Larsenimonas sp. GH3-8]|uniref:RimK family protein n=2 Tax=Larsenimonas rhizosphaerae TaxID=2944682 RepID=A0AA41ZEN8_9GAMM|nr:RimK family protein [Larsenimonas rhizosphaerae]MCM2130511.1 RimK family protein [Larsenimonas rhizosphaerae]MCX2523216.1 RimK family protein [Larsenimonas rhizosphaerae]
MSRLRIVVDQLSDWRSFYPSDDVITAEEYLAQDTDIPAPMKATHVINLCSELDYLGTGYYVSLLAQARGQRVQPSVETLSQMSRHDLLALELDGLQRWMAVLERQGSVPGDELVLRLFFGHSDVPSLAILGRRLFEHLPCPLMEVTLSRHNGRWQLTGLQPLPFSALPQAEEERFASALNNHSRQIWRTPAARRRYRFDLAILIDPEEAMPPSNKGALKAFIRAGRKIGIDVSLITRHDEGRLAEFDGLFIRETTRIDHHTYRMARRAEHEGLVVIDDPTSILRCTNKVYLHAMLRDRHVPAPGGHLLSRHDAGLAALAETLSYPQVLKIPDGAFSRGISKVRSPAELLEQAEGLFKDSALLLLQEWMPTDYDWRVGILDDKVLFVSRYYMARGHWQIYDHSKGKTKSGGFDTLAPEDAPPQVLKVALKAARLIGRGLYGVDLKQSGERVVVIEVNDNPNLDAGIEDVVAGKTLYDTVMQVFLARMSARRA